MHINHQPLKNSYFPKRAADKEIYNLSNLYWSNSYAPAVKSAAISAHASKPQGIGQKPSSVWMKGMVKDGNRAKCTFCNNVFAGSTSSLKRHLRIHGVHFDEDCDRASAKNPGLYALESKPELSKENQTLSELTNLELGIDDFDKHVSDNSSSADFRFSPSLPPAETAASTAFAFHVDPNAGLSAENFPNAQIPNRSTALNPYNAVPGPEAKLSETEAHLKQSGKDMADQQAFMMALYQVQLASSAHKNAHGAANSASSASLKSCKLKKASKISKHGVSKASKELSPLQVITTSFPSTISALFLNKKLAELIRYRYVTFDTVQSAKFAEFLRFLNPSYNVPTRSELRILVKGMGGLVYSKKERE